MGRFVPAGRGSRRALCTWPSCGACAFIPAILMSPIGGIIADGVNKRIIMVILDFFTAAVILTFSLFRDGANLIFLLTITLMLLYGIAGAYQSAVQASIPALVSQNNLMAANSIINTISSLASLIGPVLGGVVYSAYGLAPVLWVCMACFIMSAVMEIFIKILFRGQALHGRIWKIARADFAESVHFIRKERPVVEKVLFVACGINLFLSAMSVVALPYLVTEVFPLEAAQANRLYGFAEGILAAGGFCGGMCAGIFADRLSIQKSGNLLVVCAACVFPVSGAWCIAIDPIRNSELHRYNGVLLSHYDFLNDFYCTDHIFHPGGNAAKFNGKGTGCQHYRLYVYAAVRSRIIWRPVPDR